MLVQPSWPGSPQPGIQLPVTMRRDGAMHDPVPAPARIMDEAVAEAVAAQRRSTIVVAAIAPLVFAPPAERRYERRRKRLGHGLEPLER